MKFKKTIICFALLSPAIVFANKIDNVETTPDSPNVNSELTLKLNFTSPVDKVSCGIGIDWGDGEKQKLRIGNGQQIAPPFKFTHSYKTPGVKKIAIKGEFIARGVSSLSGCEVNLSGLITIQDPEAQAELAAKEKSKNGPDNTASTLSNEPNISRAEKSSAVLGSYAGANDWVKVYDDDFQDVYILKSFIKPITNPQITKRGFTLIDMSNYKKIPEDVDSIASITHISLVDCDNPGYKNNGGSIFKKHYANGLGKEIPSSAWVNIPQANEAAKAIYTAICEK